MFNLDQERMLLSFTTWWSPYREMQGVAFSRNGNVARPALSFRPGEYSISFSLSYFRIFYAIYSTVLWMDDHGLACPLTLLQYGVS